MQPFTPSELEVMQVLWKHGRLKPGEIEANFPRPIRNAALRSILLILLEKGHVTRTREGKAYFYEAHTPSQGTLRSMARKLADIFCGGSTSALILQLIQTEKLTPEDIQELEAIARRASGTETPQPSSTKPRDRTRKGPRA